MLWKEFIKIYLHVVWIGTVNEGVQWLVMGRVLTAHGLFISFCIAAWCNSEPDLCSSMIRSYKIILFMFLLVSWASLFFYLDILARIFMYLYTRMYYALARQVEMIKVDFNMSVISKRTMMTQNMQLIMQAL